MTTLLRLTYGDGITTYLRSDWRVIGEFWVGTETDEYGIAVREPGCREAELWVARRRIATVEEVAALPGREW